MNEKDRNKILEVIKEKVENASEEELEDARRFLEAQGNKLVTMEVEFKIKLSKWKDIMDLSKLCDKWMKEAEK